MFIMIIWILFTLRFWWAGSLTCEFLFIIFNYILIIYWSIRMTTTSSSSFSFRWSASSIMTSFWISTPWRPFSISWYTSISMTSSSLSWRTSISSTISRISSIYLSSSIIFIASSLFIISWLTAQRLISLKRLTTMMISSISIIRNPFFILVISFLMYISISRTISCQMPMLFTQKQFPNLLSISLPCAHSTLRFTYSPKTFYPLNFLIAVLAWWWFLYVINAN